MRLPRPASRPTSSTFSRYDTAAAWARAALGADRLTRAQAAQVRAAVARHEARSEATTGRHPIHARMTTLARLRERLRSETEDAVAPFTDHHRSKGNADVRVEVGDEPRAWVSAPTKYVSGRGGFGHVVTDTTEHITVCPSWRRRVLAPGLARLDGLLTTHARPVLVDGDITVYRAAWVRQGRGYNLGVESGYIAHHAPSGAAYHVACPGGGVAGDAARGLRRKMKAQAIPADVRASARSERNRKRVERRSAAIARLAGQLSRLDVSEVGHVVVSREDSLRAGNCVPGTDDFIERFLPGRESATVAEIARAIGRHDVASLAGADLTLARQLGAAVLVAIRKDRNARRLVLA